MSSGQACGEEAAGERPPLQTVPTPKSDAFLGFGGGGGGGGRRRQKRELAKPVPPCSRELHDGLSGLQCRCDVASEVRQKSELEL